MGDALATVATLLLFSIEVPVWAAVAIATAAVFLFSVSLPVLITFSAEVSSQYRTGVGLLGTCHRACQILDGFYGRAPQVVSTL